MNAIIHFRSWIVSASTQNQALSALLFLYKVLSIEVGRIDEVPRAQLSIRVPVVLSRDEVRSVLKQLTGTIWIIVVILYGVGLRIQDCLALRVKDIDFDRHQNVVRRGKGQKDVRTMLPVAVRDRLQAHLEGRVHRLLGGQTNEEGYEFNRGPRRRRAPQNARTITSSSSNV